ncbi:pyridoxal-dependent decarboxylase domain-containing protein 1 [Culicoides brevitarsis]|uniref:pyridoxal-dependent decarboxylase domain-containing protein 1 n=1 Tax=Culicoides brevitarsis TaxID=469753 RepID=UPI00307BCDB7
MTEELMNNTTKPKITEIPAVNVRNSLESLSRLESSASQVVHRLESLKTATEENVTNSNAAAAPTYYFHPDKKLPSEILTSLEALVSQPYDPDSDEIAEYPLPPLDEMSHLVLVSHSITSYLSYLNRRQLMKVTSKILTDTGRWLSQMFRYVDCAASYHKDSSECLVRAIRLAMAAKFPNYYENGVKSLPDVSLYISENSSPLILQFACRQIGLPVSSIIVVPCSNAPGCAGTMDIAALQKLISFDVTVKRVPLFLVANLGASLLGESDNILKLQELCHANQIWLHGRGHNLASMILGQGALDSNTTICDSMTLNLSNWFGVPAVPSVLLYKPVANISPAMLFDSDPLLSRYLSAISVWMMLQSMGREAISDRILAAFQSCKAFYDIVSKVNGLQVLSKVPAANVPITELLNKPLNVALLFDTAVPVVVFKFDLDLKELNKDSEASNDKTADINASYIDRLNSWLGQILQRDSSQIELEIIDHGKHGTCIRFCPLELGIGELPPPEEYLESFATSIDAQVEILRATVKHKQTFNRLVRENPVLQLVELSDWAGLGGVRYVPEFIDATTDGDESKQELNKLNNHLVDQLRATDSAFSLGEADGMTCVRFGMVTEDTDVNELLELVVDAGQSIQEDSKVLDSMSEIVKKGIEAATLDLQRENEEKLWQEGILRHVPVFGHFVNWFSPPPKEGGIKGRSLNLQQGVVETTENIYKYHMQLPSGVPATGQNSSGHTPLSGHSRSESQSSATNTQTTTKPLPGQTQQQLEPIPMSEETPTEDNKPAEATKDATE